MEQIPYASIVGSLMYSQTCTRPDISFVVRMLGRYQSNPGIDHWKMVNKVLCYAKGTKGLMLTYRRSDSLEIKGYSDADYAGDVDDSSRRGSYIMEKLQTDSHGIIHDDCRVHSML